MVKIQAQKIPKPQVNLDDIVARFCLIYPQYTFAQAQKLPFKRIMQMLRVALKEEARRMYDLTNIIAAPSTKKGQGVKKMLQYYQRIMEENNG